MTAAIDRERMFFIYRNPDGFSTSGTFKYIYFQTIFGGNIDKDNINHPSESHNFFPKAYHEFPKK
jgi:hypothetical protein